LPVNRYSVDFLKTVTTNIFVACGTPLEDASIVAEQLVAANLMGLDSHGVALLPLYVKWIGRGTTQPGAPVAVAYEQGGISVVDCGFNFGQVGGLRAMQVAIEKATEHSVACVLTRHCNHVGRLGYFTQMAAEAGMFALATCNSAKSGHYVVPFGGLEGRLATNPISYAVPGGEYPLVADFSTSTMSQGNVHLYRDRGQELPEGAVIDAAGNPTIDPGVLYGSPRGWILPLGGAFGYKGFALGLLVEILSGTLIGDRITAEKHDGSNGVCFIVIDISAFLPVDQFRELMGDLIAYMKSAPPAPGFEEVMLPGEIDFQIMAERLAQGIPIAPATWQSIQETAQALDVSVATVA
jgi:uncharacterized oxidoreductase